MGNNIEQHCSLSNNFFWKKLAGLVSWYGRKEIDGQRKKY
jgi:hypothetical protein